MERSLSHCSWSLARTKAGVAVGDDVADFVEGGVGENAYLDAADG
jgi:polyribonucleotide nucleotidyltransferase